MAKNRNMTKALLDIADDVLDLHFYEHLSVSQIAAKLGITKEAVLTIETWSWKQEKPAKYYKSNEYLLGNA